MNFKNYELVGNPDFNFLAKDSLDIIKVKNSTDIQEEMYLYSKNFLSAANALACYTLESRRIGKLDFWFFPIVYLYRQSLELLLKSIAFKYLKDSASRSTFIKEVGHNLELSYNQITPFLQKEGLNLNSDVFTWLDTYLKDITKKDKESDMFRYPFSINMVKYFAKQTHINLLGLCQNMESAYNIINSALSKTTLEGEDLILHTPVLLIKGGSYYTQSVIGRNFSSSNHHFYPYIEGYMESADYLYELIKIDNEKCSLFLPMCYMYRNGIELALKRILLEDCRYDYIEATKILKNKKHSVQGLWNKIKDDIKHYTNAPKDDKTMLYVERYIEDLHKMDGSSMRFRYPMDKLITLYFKRGKKYDLDNVSSYFNALFTFLDNVDMMISSYKENSGQMEAEVQSYYSQSDYY
ncbi:hypothetical protein M1E11_23850 (plasmid) [Bacillus sp. JZ8]